MGASAGMGCAPTRERSPHRFRERRPIELEVCGQIIEIEKVLHAQG